jgi:hypothetical protein
MTHAILWMALEALIAALITLAVVRILVARIKRSARTFTLRDAKGRPSARFTLGDEENFTSLMEREVSRLERERARRPASE